MTDIELDTVIDGELVDDRPDHLPAAGRPLDVNDALTDEAAEDLANSGRDRTRSTYEERFAAFARWCADHGRVPGPPTTEKNLISYASYLKRTDTPPGTLRMAIAGIRHMNARAGYEDHPNASAALEIYKDHRYAWANTGRGQRSSAPVDMDRLRQMLTGCDADTLVGLRDRVLLEAGYFIRARASELAALRIGDHKRVSANLVVFTKRVSKNDKTSAGREYEVDDPTFLADLRAWLAALEERGQGGRHLPLLRSVDMWGNLGPVSPKTGQGITRQAVNNIVKARAADTGVDVAEAITAHGLRAGVPTDLGAQDFTAGEIKDITGDWSSLEMVERYRKVGLRRAGKRTDDGRRAAALSMLRIAERINQTTTEEPRP